MAAAARQARFMALRYAFSFAGAWKPAPTCSATKNLRVGILEALAFSSPAPTAVSLAPPPVAITTSTLVKLSAGTLVEMDFTLRIFLQRKKIAYYFSLAPCESYISGHRTFVF